MSSEKVWSKFSVTKSDGEVINLRIQDLPSDRYEDAMDFNIEYFAKHEIFHKTAGIDKNPEALAECRQFVSEMMRDPTHHIAVCCVDEPDRVGDILGVSTMSLTTNDEDFDLDDLQIKTQEWKKFFEFLEVKHSLYDVMKEENVTKSFDGRGIAVHSAYRGLGIATEFCRTRPLICKEQNVPLTWAWMTSLGSQKAAERANWETVFQIPFADLSRRIGVQFDGSAPYCKIMVARIK